ncbi:MAG: hypothetical protein ABI056_01780, partial [Caulobacteraceae bacterium]
LLPPAQRATARWLGLAVVLVMLAIVSIAASAAFRAWRSVPAPDPTGLTLTVAANGLESPDAAAARAAERLAGAPGVLRAETIEPSADKLPIDDAASPTADPAREPRSVHVVMRPGARTPRSVLVEWLRADAITLSPRAPGEDLLDSMAGAWLAALACLGLALAALSAWMTARLTAGAFAESASTLELLRGLGADEGFLWRLLARRTVLPALLAEGLAVAVASALVAVLLALAPPDGLASSLAPPDLAAALIWIPVPALLSAALALDKLRRSARAWP